MNPEHSEHSDHSHADHGTFLTIASYFGWHIAFNLVFSILLGLLITLVMRRRGHDVNSNYDVTSKYYKLGNNEGTCKDGVTDCTKLFDEPSDEECTLQL